MTPIAFIENKPFDLAAVNALLAASRERNHYTNFGPVSVALERKLLDAVGISATSTLSTMFCCNGSVALNAAAGALSTKRGRNLRWLVSANGFFSTRIGPFTDSLVVDCDDRGLLDMDLVEKTADSNFDGVVYTNLFGYFDDFERVFAYCRDHDKPLIIDNAASLGSLRRFYDTQMTAGVDWIETFSFHQTKPWGMGEGGAAVFPADLRDGFRAMINFGIDLAPDVQIYAGNGKVSEFACALIETRLDSMPAWSRDYLAQARRIVALAQEAGLRPIVTEVPDFSVPGHVPLLSSRPLSFADLENETLVLQKYYRSLDDSCPNATQRYAHTFSVPCHQAVADIEDATLLRLLTSLA
jgi:dTDP-4-amino-4,6-dideoxygalactose transaminase